MFFLFSAFRIVLPYLHSCQEIILISLFFVRIGLDDCSRRLFSRRSDTWIIMVGWHFLSSSHPQLLCLFYVSRARKLNVYAYFISAYEWIFNQLNYDLIIHQEKDHSATRSTARTDSKTRASEPRYRITATPAYKNIRRIQYNSPGRLYNSSNFIIPKNQRIPRPWPQLSKPTSSSLIIPAHLYNQITITRPVPLRPANLPRSTRKQHNKKARARLVISLAHRTFDENSSGLSGGARARARARVYHIIPGRHFMAINIFTTRGKTNFLTRIMLLRSRGADRKNPEVPGCIQ